MKVLRFPAVILLACLLSSCESDNPTVPSNPPPPPTPSPSIPANVTATMTVVSAVANSDFIGGAVEASLQLAVQTVFTNLGTEAALLGDGTFHLFLDGGAMRTRTRSGGQTVPGSGQLTVTDTFFTDIVIGGPNTTISGVDQLRTWTEISDPTNSGTITIDQVPVPPNLVGIDDRPCASSASVLCLRNNRFQVSVDWRDFNGTTGVGTVLPGATSDEGTFWFFNPNNTELLIRVLDGCADNGHFWVFAAATTNVEVDITVTDTMTGLNKQYFSPLGTVNPEIIDTQAFATCPAPVPVP